MGNIVAIVGRPNVGKSTFFNRFVSQRKAIVDNESGVTRDRHYGQSEWNGLNFTVIDTGGYVENSKDTFESAIRNQVILALKEATVIVFMVDCHSGLHNNDKEFSKIIREIGKKTIIAANKADNYQYGLNSNEFYELGLKNSEIIPISSQTGSGTGDLLDLVVKNLKKNNENNEKNDVPRIAILGRPNVGKSSFINSLIGEERNIVTDIPGTTRDAIDSRYKLFNNNVILTDTAGIRKKNKVKQNLEFYSIMRSIQALHESDICVVMIDAHQGFQSQDMNLISLANKYKKGIILMVNKWDLIKKKTSTSKEYEVLIYSKLKPLTFVPIIFSSVKKKQRILQVIEIATKIFTDRNKKISTSKLNNTLLPEIKKYPPPAIKGKHIKIKYITQLPVPTPIFAFFCNLPQYIKEPYKRFLTNKIRYYFDFSGVPIKTIIKKK